MSVFTRIFKHSKYKKIKEHVNIFINNLSKVEKVNTVEDLKDWMISIRGDLTIDDFLDVLENTPEKTRIEMADISVKKYEDVICTELDTLQKTLEFVMANKEILQQETVLRIKEFVEKRDAYLKNVRSAFKYIITVLVK